MSKDEKPIEIKQEHKIFAQEYIYDWNASRAYKVAYPSEKSDETIRAAASRLLTNVNVHAYIEEIQKDLEKQAKISRLMVIREHQKLAFSSIAHLHNTWIERKEFGQLTEDQKSCISEIDTKILKKNIGTNDEPEIVDVEHVKIKLYDKQKALDAISKMLGYNQADKVDVTTGGEKVNIYLPDNGRG